MIPKKVNPGTRERNKKFEEQLRRMLRECGEEKAFVAHFDAITWRWYLPTRDELEFKWGLPVLRRFKDGGVFAIPLKPDAE
ncbi:MAG: hypothetical protein GY859_13135 [Desulfobacterales bacterium]|nr:hypothetical protein [Desulfobacterales bacterium]